MVGNSRGRGNKTLNAHKKGLRGTVVFDITDYLGSAPEFVTQIFVSYTQLKGATNPFEAKMIQFDFVASILLRH